MPTLATTVDGLKLPNPFVIGSGPPGTNLNVIAKAFERRLGRGHRQDDQPRRLARSSTSRRATRSCIPSDRQGSHRLGKHRADQRPAVSRSGSRSSRSARTSIPTACSSRRSWRNINKDAWVEIVERCQDAGVDAFELNFSCPHGLPERKMGAAMGQDPEILEEVCGWVMGAAKKPVWAKMTPNVTHIEDPSRAALARRLPRASARSTRSAASWA